MPAFDSSHYDVLVIGGGEAALAAAIAAKEEGAQVAIISKGKIGFSGSSVMSNAVHSAIFSAGDSPEIFYQDIVKGSRNVTDRKLARVFAHECTERVNELETKYHIHVERERKVRTPGHSFPRRVYVGHGLGKNITNTLAAYARELKVDFFHQIVLLDFIQENDEIQGVVVENKGKLLAYYASAIILATGGFGSLYDSSDNPRDVSGEGIGIAYRHGASLVDMEFIQFYPYRLKTPANIDVLTKIFAKGAYLVNEKNERFMEKYPNKELETRDVLCYEMFKQKNVYLHFSQVPEDILKIDSPSLYRLSKKGMTGPWMMQPVQHYCMGGIRVDEWGRTNIRGLYACGECTGGLHGANRLAGGSLSETLVFGTRAGQMAAKESISKSSKETQTSPLPIVEEYQNNRMLLKEEIQEIRKHVKKIMWEKVGIEKSTTSLKEAATQLETIIKQLEENKSINALQLADQLRAAWAAAYSGSIRKESRGAHQIQNIREEKKEWQQKIILQKDHTYVLAQV